MDWWFANLLQQSPALLVSWVFWVIFSICLHELGHGWAAIRRGDSTPIELGHMTWNPLVHMGPMSLLIFLFIGIAWGAMPYNPHRLRGRYAEAFVALAGPGVNLALAAICILGSTFWARYASGVGDPLFMNVSLFWWAGAYLNFALLILNLLPMPPLDGSRVLADFVSRYRAAISQPQAMTFSTIILLFILIFGGRHIFAAAGALTSTGTDLLSRLLP